MRANSTPSRKTGGVARRLTSGPGYTSFPRFSPDGKQLAFTSQYDGNTEVYVMPGDGGEPKRLTTTATLGRDDVSDRMGPNNIVMGWENTQPLVVFRSRRTSFNSFIGDLETVGLDAELPKQLPVPRGGFVSFSPDDSKMAFNRVFREFRTWKHYRGGMADDVWIFDFKTQHDRKPDERSGPGHLPDVGPGQPHLFPLRSRRADESFLDRSRRPKKRSSSRPSRISTSSSLPSARTRSSSKKRATSGATIWRPGKSAPVPIEIKEDFASGRAAFVDASKHTESVNLAPDGQRAIVVARGDLFSVPAKDGTSRALTKTSNAHERDAVWSPDGKWIAYNSDETGENELYVRAQDGKGQPQQLTKAADTYYYQPIWSPDSKKLLWSDRLQRLRYVDVASKAVTEVAQDKVGEIRVLRLVARQPVDCLGAAGSERSAEGLSLFRREQEVRPGDGRMVSARAGSPSVTMANT